MSLQKMETRAPKSADKEKTIQKTSALLEELSELQNVLYAQSRYKVLIIFQGMDASGKDGTIKNVFKGINPLGCRVQAFKTPTEEEKAHDFLWRIHKQVPQNGMIQIFNRSYYEDILVPSVYKLAHNNVIESRYEHINNFESLLKDADTLVIKFFLNISKVEQAERLQERQTNPEKFWKHDDNDIVDRKSWDKFMKVYEEIFEKCDKIFPWHIIPADQKWYRNYCVAKVIVDELKELNLRYPPRRKNKSET